MRREEARATMMTMCIDPNHKTENALKRKVDE